MPIFCKNESKVKLVIYFEDGPGAARFYSVLKENKKPWGVLTDKMIRRILKNKYSFNFKRAIFYDNFTDKEFKTVLGSQYNPPKHTNDEFDTEKSIVKATLITMDHKAKVFHSRINEEKQLGFDPLEIKQAMLKRLKAKFEFRKLTFEMR